MSDRYATCLAALRAQPLHWLVTGAAGFIGSHLVETLLRYDQFVCGLDNFSTGRRENLEALARSLSPEHIARFRFIEGDILDPACCLEAAKGAQLILHEAALGSVSRSVKDPVLSNRVNVEGFLQLLLAARACGVRRVVYASSSSVYGDTSHFPMVEHILGSLQSPYATTKRFNELYAQVFCRLYGMDLVGLRYFNVFGPRQNPEGEYAAVIPRWIHSRLGGQQCTIFGDGTTSRDFCYVDNVVQANLLAATTPANITGEVFNIALGGETSLIDLYSMIDSASSTNPADPRFTNFRPGDIHRSRADISKASKTLGYHPAVLVADGIRRTVEYFKTSGSKR
ncbi:MAG: SDR family oxidoreductase [Bdellovibrionota bacterium]|nr:MAG: SDR family oxidoreductase [Bdellovibrionota bacterium]